jgi:hypothetical protein
MIEMWVKQLIKISVSYVTLYTDAAIGNVTHLEYDRRSPDERWVQSEEVFHTTGWIDYSLPRAITGY